MNPNVPQFEKYWRERIATELEEYINAGGANVRSETVAAQQPDMGHCCCRCVRSGDTNSGA